MKKRLYKSNDNKMIDGVCGGITEFFDIDPTFFTSIRLWCGLDGSCSVLPAGAVSLDI